MRRKHLSALLASLLATTTFSCSADDQVDGENASFPEKGDGTIDEGSPEALAVLALVNDPAVTIAELDDDAGLDARAATNIIAHRDGPDAQAETGDDDPFDNLAELDGVSFVGPIALDALLAYAREKGLLVEDAATASVLFSPLPLDASHNARIAELIGQAKEHIDIAMYSYSSAAIADALEAAVARGVDVRFIFETANTTDKSLTGSALQSSASGRLESMGVNVRFVNKIMHHKIMIVDGPRNDVGKATTARIASGSANWSTGGATIYDENTMFLSGVPEIALELQREFDLMWTHSRDLVAQDLPFTLSTLEITDAVITDHPDMGVHFTSDNFSVSAGSTTFRLKAREEMAAARGWVEAIEGATDSILIASGHMRLKPVAEALIAKKLANPNMDIRVYVDQQEYISAAGDSAQRQSRADCLASADNANEVFDCENKAFLWAKALSDAGIDVRYKAYSYRWHFSYAEQMHNKFMLIDGAELLSGSYNLSINAEHSTFENILHFRAPTFDTFIGEFGAYFERIWDTGRASDQLSDLRAEIETSPNVPLVFDSMALTWDEYTDLKTLLRDNCAQINSEDFRKNPQNHKVCPR